jgi:hypothetical protein
MTWNPTLGARYHARETFRTELQHASMRPDPGIRMHSVSRSARTTPHVLRWRKDVGRQSLEGQAKQITSITLGLSKEDSSFVDARKIALRYPSCPTPFVFKVQAPHFLTGVVLILFLSLGLTRSLSFIGRCAGTVSSFTPLSLSTNIQPTYQGYVYLFLSMMPFHVMYQDTH